MALRLISFPWSKEIDSCQSWDRFHVAHRVLHSSLFFLTLSFSPHCIVLSSHFTMVINVLDKFNDITANLKINRSHKFPADRVVVNKLWQLILQMPLLFFQEIHYVDSRMTTAGCSCVPRHPFSVTKASKYADQLTIAGIIDFGWQNNIITLF